MYILYVYLWFEYIFTFIYMEEFQKSQGFLFLFFSFVFQEDFQSLKKC